MITLIKPVWAGLVKDVETRSAKYLPKRLLKKCQKNVKTHWKREANERWEARGKQSKRKIKQNK